MLRKLLSWVLILAVMAFCAWWLYPYLLPTSAKVSRVQAQILKKAAHHDWDKVASMVAEDYRDPAGMNKQEAMQTAKEILNAFLTLEFEWTNETVTVEDQKATVTGTLRMKGMGPAGGGAIIERVNKIEKPWTFVWQRDPMSALVWRLTSVSNAEAENLKD